METLTQELVHEWLAYYPESGKFYWKKVKKTGRANVGAEAGGLNSMGYRMIKIGGKRHMTHRIVWLMENGNLPNGSIDHVNGIKDDNRPCNLRQVTASFNNSNVKARLRNKCGHIGVCFNPSRQKWVARIVSEGKVLQKYCTSESEAIAARASFERQVGRPSR